MNSPQIQFSDRKTDIDLHQLQQLFNMDAFWAKGRSIEDLGIAIANSDPVITVWDGERLIGFARATSDGVYRATIWDVVIRPEYRSLGLGSNLMERVLSHQRMNRVERVYLMTTHQQQFYEKIGFQCNSTTTMVLYNKPKFSSRTAVEIQLQESLGGSLPPTPYPLHPSS